MNVRPLSLVSAALAGGCSGTLAEPASGTVAFALAVGVLALWGLVRWRRRAAVRAAFDDAGLALLTLDTRLRVRHISAAARRLLTPALRVRQPLLQACPGLENGPLHHALERAAGGEPTTVEDCGALCAGPTRGRVRQVGRRLWVVLEDDAERRRTEAALHTAEHALREDRQRLALAVEAAGVGLWEWELGSERVRYSRGWKRLLGYEDDEVVDEFGEWKRLVHPDDATVTLKQLVAYLADPNGLFRTEFRMRHRDGGWRWILSTGALQPDRHNARYLLGAHVDITVDKQAQAALAASEAKLRRVVDGLGPNMFVALLDLDGIIRWVNQSVVDASGSPLEVFLGQPIPDTPAWENDPVGRARVAESIRTAAAGQAVRFDQQVEVAGGQHLWLDYSLQPLREADGSVQWLVASATNITARKQAQEALAASEMKLRRMVDGLGPSMFVALLDLDGIVHWINQAVLDASGMPRDTFIGRPLIDAPAWQNDPVGRARMAEAIRTAAGGQALRFDQQVEVAGGQHLWLDNSLQVIREADGSVNWLLVSAADVTARKHAEHDLREAAAHLRRLAERLVAVHDAEQRRFSAELHDRIGQNLTALGVGLQLLSGANLDADARAARLGDTRQLLERTTAAVRDLISELRPPGLDEYGLLSGLRSLAEDAGRRSGLRILARGQDPNPRLPPEHETALYRIAQEAVVNTVRHARAHSVELTLAKDAHGPLLRVADDGEGFDPARVARGHWGLEIMRERAASIGARMRLVSAPGHGTCITVGFGPRP